MLAAAWDSTIFRAAAHIIAQVAAGEGREVYAFTSPGDCTAQAFARSLGVVWGGAQPNRRPLSSTPRSFSRRSALSCPGAVPVCQVGPLYVRAFT